MKEIIMVYLALNYPEYRLMSAVAKHDASKEADELEMM